MDNCNLDKLSVSRGKLQPTFSSQVTEYTVTVESSVVKVNLDIVTSDSGASYNVLFGEGSSSIRLSDGLNQVEVEVVAENGAVKKYRVSITKLSASASQLGDLSLTLGGGDLTLGGGVQLQPAFTSTQYEYSCVVPFHWSSVTLLPKVLDKKMKVSVNGGEVSQPVPVNVGDTTVQVSVTSADGSTSQVYEVQVTRDLLPLPVTFRDVKQQLDFECPVSLSAFYRPVSVRLSDPKHTFSGPYLEMLARRSKVDPLSDAPLGTDWKVDEPELEREVSGADVKCFFAYRGCDSVMKLCELGSHTLTCTHRPTGELEPKEVTESGWYKRLFASSATFEIETKHTLEVRRWEKKLQLAAGDDSVETLCEQGHTHLGLYRQHLLKSGGSVWQSKDREAAVESLSAAAELFASAVALGPKDAKLHFLLGLVMEEQHYATEVFRLQKKVEKPKETVSEAKSASRQEEVLAVCQLHGLLQGGAAPSVEKQMQALDKEHQQLKEQGQSSRADYIQTLFLWLAEKTGKAGSSALQDEEKQGFLQQALMKYLDAWSLSRDSWEFNLHVGRLMLLLKVQGSSSSRQALQHLQSGLAQQPCSAALRFFTGLALLQQEAKASEETEKEAALFLQQGLEHFVNQRCSKRWEEHDASEPLSSINTQFLRGLLCLAELQLRNVLPEKKGLSSQHVYHTVAVLAAQTVSRCVGQGGRVSGQLEWPLLDAHFALLQGLIQQGHTQEAGPLVARRCQALSALVRLSCIAPCQELLDLQERVCEVGVVSSPRDSGALALLGLAQLAQHGNNPNAEKSEEAVHNARLSFHASMELEEQSQRGGAPPQLSEQKWWQDRQKAEAEKQTKGGTGPSDAAAAAGASRGRGGGAGRGGRGGPGPSRPPAPPPRAPAAAPSASTRGGKAAPPAAKGPAARGKPGAAAAAAPGPAAAAGKPKLPADKSKQACGPDPAETAEAPPPDDPSAEPAPVNRRSHLPRLGLARALSLSAETREQAAQLYSEVIAMAPEFHDAYIELVQLLEASDRRAAVDVYCRFPLKPADEQSYDDAFITGEIVRLLMALEEFDHPQLSPNLVAYGKIMGLSSIEKYIDILDSKCKSAMLRSVYAKINDRDEKDPELQDFFRYKCWI